MKWIPVTIYVSPEDVKALQEDPDLQLPACRELAMSARGAERRIKFAAYVACLNRKVK